MAKALTERFATLSHSGQPDIRPMIEEFVDVFYRQCNPRRAFEAYVAADYIQHNPGLTDGHEPALAMLEPLFGKAGAVFDVKRIVIDNDIAVVHLHGRPDAALPGVAVADIYRVADGKIAEHWDVIQPVVTDGVNPRGMF